MDADLDINDVKSKSTFSKIIYERLFDLEYGEVKVQHVEVINGQVAMDGVIELEGFRNVKFTCIQSVHDLRRILEEHFDDED